MQCECGTCDVHVSYVCDDGRLVSAVERDDTCRLQQLLTSSEHDYCNASGILQLAKCLYIAAARGHLACARLLLDAGAQPNIRGDTNGNTPLVCTSLGTTVCTVYADIATGPLDPRAGSSRKL